MKILLIRILLVLTVGCIGHKTNIHKEPLSFDAYDMHVTIDKDGTITYYPVLEQREKE